MLNSHHSQLDPAVLIQNSGDKAQGSPLRRGQFNHGPGPSDVSSQPGARTGPNLTAADDGPHDGAHYGAEHRARQMVDMDQPSQGYGLSTATGTNGPSPSNGPLEIKQTASIDRGSDNGPAVLGNKLSYLLVYIIFTCLVFLLVLFIFCRK